MLMQTTHRRSPPRYQLRVKIKVTFHSLGLNIPPHDYEYLRVSSLIQAGTQSSTPQTSQIGYLLTEVMISWLNLSTLPRRLLMMEVGSLRVERFRHEMHLIYHSLGTRVHV